MGKRKKQKPADNTKSFIFNLNTPFEYHGEQTVSIKVRRATLKDLIENEEHSESARHGVHKRNAYFYSALTGMSPHALEQMDASDWIRFMDEVGTFLGLNGSGQVN